MSNIAKNQIDQFIELIQQGINSWLKAAEIAREELRKDPEWADKVQEKNRLITAQAVHRFASIGVKFIPQLAISECPGAKRLRQLPLAVQEDYFSRPLPLLIQTGEGWERLLVDLHNLTSEQAAQVFAEDHIRTEGEQRAWLEDRRAKQAAPPVKANLPWRIVGKEVVVMAGARLKARELLQILQELEK